MNERENPFAAVTYRKSVAHIEQLDPDVGREVAIAGRSNSGKSSAINAICDHKGLARTSKTPGRTQTLNIFRLSETQRLIDLPGYGYARVPAAVQAAWQVLLDQYFAQRQSLCGLLVTMDIRHPLTPHDRRLLDYATARELAVHILLTKTDKLGRGAAAQTLSKAQQELNNIYPGQSISLFSALNKLGVVEARVTLRRWLQAT